MIIKPSLSIDETPYMLCHSIICVTKLPSNCQKQSWNAALLFMVIHVVLWYAPSPSDIFHTSCCLSVFNCPACFLWFCFLSIYLLSSSSPTCSQSNASWPKFLVMGAFLFFFWSMKMMETCFGGWISVKNADHPTSLQIDR
jgi:hypothetical protein